MAPHTHLRLAFGILHLSLFIGVSCGSHTLYPHCFDPSGQNYINNINLTFKNCTSVCPDWEQYETVDVFQRISLWIVPLIVLVGNFQVAPLGSLNTIFSVIHLLGDPIDSMCSLLTKLEVSKRLHARWISLSTMGNSANDHGCIELEELVKGTVLQITPEQARDLATVNSIFDDWDFSTNSVFESMFQTLTHLDAPGRDGFITACIDAAHRLSESRADERRRTSFAVLGYIVAIIAAFLKTLTGKSQTLDRKIAFSIAFSMSMSGLIPAVVLSTMVGSFTSNRVAVRIIRDLKAELGDSWHILDPGTWQVSSTLRNPVSRCAVWKSWETLDNTLPYAGGNYSYRPSKYVPPTGLLPWNGFIGDRSTTKIYIYSVLPLIIAVGCAITVTWLTPTKGFSCRSLVQLSFLLLWIMSLFLTWISGYFLTGKYRWYAILIKDFIIALIIWGLIIAAFVGRLVTTYLFIYLSILSFYLTNNFLSLDLIRANAGSPCSVATIMLTSRSML
ncbi:hypothetical protein BDD12DRAFT_726849 [Trichophaea hybrida]|nr:hypothetical protein BDD12DRAFT_726849 [Trichophaea hybrida]